MSLRNHMREETMQRSNQNNNDNSNKWIDIPSFVNNGSEVNQTSNNLKRKSYEFDDSNAFVKEVNSSLAKQVSYDLDRQARPSSNKNSRKKKKRSRKIFKFTFFTLLTLTALACILVFTPFGNKIVAKIATEYIYGNLDYQASEKNDDSEAAGTVKEPQDKIVNILLVGIEEIGNAKNTDSMIIATMNTENHTLKLTSLMRDLYVDIEGHDPGRLNSAFARGGIDLLYDTIETNFGIKLDGHCMVNFKAFQQVVDLVGGVKVTLTSDEADYLNSTNYISEKKNRNVTVGTQMLNGNQALGYCRIRKRSTSTESNDFGRTQRQRIVLKGIYNQVKRKNVFELVGLMNKVFKEIPIETDITKSEFERYLEEAMSLKVKELESLRIPSDGSYANETKMLGSVKQEVLVPTDWNVTRAEIYNFIYGNAEGSETSKDNETATGKSSDTEATK